LATGDRIDPHSSVGERARQFPRSGVDSFHHSSRLEGGREAAEACRREHFPQVDNFEREPQVGFVDAVTVHRFVPGQAGKRDGGPLGAKRLHHGYKSRLDRLLHSRFVPERSLEIELGELDLAVRPGVLVSIATGDLEVTLDPSHHQQLLEELG
jgi:hypothetical protein